MGRYRVCVLRIWLLSLSWTCCNLQAANLPPGWFCVADQGALADGRTLTTGALQKTIDLCARQGGGTVYVPAGTYLTGTLFFQDHVTLHLAAGAVLLGSTDLQDYPERTPAFRSYTDVHYVNKSLIYAERCTNIALVGRGTIDGQGDAQVFKGKPYKERPYLIRMIECADVLVRDVTLRDSPMWVQHYLACDDLCIDGITVHSLVNHNNDGIDIDCCQRVRIANCNVNSGDDAIVLKSTAPRLCEQVVVTNCVLSSRCNAFKCGTESTGGFQDIAVSNCAMVDTHLSGIALELVDGGQFNRILVSNISMKNVHNPIFIRLGNRGRPYLGQGSKGSAAGQDGMKRPPAGSLGNVIISNITAVGADGIGCPIAGLPDHPVENVTLQNVHITFAGGGDKTLIHREIPEQEDRYPEYKMFGSLPAYGFYCHHVHHLSLEHVRLTYEEPEWRPALFCEDVQSLQITGFSGQAPVEGQAVCLQNVTRK